MANTNNFSAKDFLSTTYYAPLALDKHTVVLNNPEVVIATKEDGTDASYIVVDLKFNNGRVINKRFYGFGAKIFCDQLRQQLDDSTTDYESPITFIKTLENKTVNVWISKQSYATKQGELKTQLQFDFTAPEQPAEATSDEEVAPF